MLKIKSNGVVKRIISVGELVGGRNLWIKSKDFEAVTASGRIITLANGVSQGEGYLGFTSRKQVADDSGYKNLTEFFCESGSVSYGDIYTLSFFAKGAGDFDVNFYGETGYVKSKVLAASPQTTNIATGFGDGLCRFSLTPEWKRYIVTWEVDSIGDLTKRKVVLLRGLSSCTIEVAGIKFERGPVATDWSPAPEDIDSRLTALESA